MAKSEGGEVMLEVVLGLWLVADGIFSMVLVIDKHWKWQLARLIRTGIGVILILNGGR